MKSMAKLFTIMALTIAFSYVLAACGDKKKDPAKDGGNVTADDNDHQTKDDMDHSGCTMEECTSTSTPGMDDVDVVQDDTSTITVDDVDVVQDDTSSVTTDGGDVTDDL